MHDYEVAIVGGGPAGLATALFLTHADPALTDRVVVLEKETYPRDKICGGAIGARADKLLERIGVRVDVPSVQVAELSLRTQAGESRGRLQGMGRVVRRIEFDHELARIVRSRGIRIDEGAKVSKLTVSDAGVEITSSRGSLRAQIVVGADGVGGFVRKAIGLGPGKFRAQVIEVDTEPVASDPARDVLHFDFYDHGFTGYVWDFPTIVAGRELVCRGAYHLRLKEDSVDVRDVLAKRLAERGLDLAHYRVKRFAERGFERHESYAAPRVVLVGEAAGIDSFSGEGIPQAIEYGAFAGSYLAQKIAERDFSFEDWNKRLARATPGYDLRMREWAMLHYFGKHRALIERHVVQLPAYVQCSAQQLAGVPISTAFFLRSVAAAGGYQLLAKLASRLGSMRQRED
jgi:flavin-dependent dehydrogenase